MRQRLRRPRFLLHLLLMLVLVGGVGMGASVAVSWRLTHRARPVFAEPAPVLARAAVEEHRLVTADGIGLGAWFVRGGPGAPCVLMLHGNGGARTLFGPLLEVFAAQGTCVLAVSLRTHGDSEGEVNDFGWSARQDVLAAITFLEREAPEHPRVVYGSSLGAAAALFASREVGARVRGYVLESPYRDLRAAVNHRLEIALPRGLVQLAFHGLWLSGRCWLPIAPERVSPLEHVIDIPPEVPVLFLAGAKDRHAPLDEVEELAGRIPTQARLEIFREGEHGALQRSEPERHQRLLLDFVRTCAQRP